MLFWLSLACQNTIQDVYDVSAEELDFGTVSQGMWQSYGIRILNTGEQDLNLASISIAENGSDVFTFEGEKPDVLLTGEAAIFDIFFTPDGSRRFEAQFIVQTSSEFMPTTRVELYVEGGPSIHDMDGDGVLVDTSIAVHHSPDPFECVDFKIALDARATLCPPP